MAEDRHEGMPDEIAEGLRLRRGPCPSLDELDALRHGGLSPDEEQAVKRHVRLCPPCRRLQERAAREPTEVDDVTWNKVGRSLDARPAPWREHRPVRPEIRAGWLVAAAVAALGIGLTVWVAQPELDSRDELVSPVRGESIDAGEPSGLVDRLDLFTWSAPPVAASFHLELMLGERTVFAGEVPAAGWRPARPLRAELEPEVAYRWRVTARDDSGTVLARSEWVEFRLAP
jgi:hypothetical protein